MPRYILSRLAKLMKLPPGLCLPVTGVCVDTRILEPGDLFFALKGAQVDGHDFLGEAAAKGAAAAVVNMAFQREVPGLPLLHVRDVLKSLQMLARKLLAERQAKIIAVTGSVGKTTTKDFITAILSKKYRVACSPGNSNSQIGIPLALLNHTQGDEEVLVLEMGMTQAGHLKNLVKIAPPDIAVITTTALVHACNFDSLSDIGLAKAEIFSHPKTVLGILDRGIENFEELQAIGKCDKLSFSLHNPSADVVLKKVAGKLIVTNGAESVDLPLLSCSGDHNRHNFLAAALAARSLGLSWEEIAMAVPALQLPERRLQHTEKFGALFVNDSYNASSISVKAALSSIPAPKNGCKRIAVLGEMVELGSFSKRCHREVAEYALERVDHMLCFGNGCKVIEEVWKEAGKPVKWHLERSGIVEELRRVLTPGDVVLLKGSRAKGVWNVLDEL